MTFNKNIFQIIGPEIKYTASEQKLWNEIKEVSVNPDISKPVEEVQPDILDAYFGKYKYMVYGMVYGLMLFYGFLMLYNLIKK